MAKLSNLLDFVSGRLTLTSGTPITTADVTAATTVYFTPYKGGRIALYSTTSSSWVFRVFTEISISLALYTADKNYDIWAYDNAGTVTLESLVWTDDTTRATALTTQNGIYVKTGDATRRYLGTIRITGTIGQTEDSASKRYVWNYYNRCQRPLRFYSSASHNYSSATPRYWNNTSASRVELVIGVSEDAVLVMITARILSGGSNSLAYVYVTIDSPDTGIINEGVDVANSTLVTVQIGGATAPLLTQTTAGYHYFAAIEQSHVTGTTTFTLAHLSAKVLG